MTRIIGTLLLVAVMAAPGFAQKKQEGHCELRPPPGCPPEGCESPGPQPEDPCGELNGKRRDLERLLDVLNGNLRALTRVLETKYGRAVTNAELDVYDAVTSLVSLPGEVASKAGSLAVRVAKWAAKEGAQKLAEAAAQAGLDSLEEPVPGDEFSQLEIYQLERILDATIEARTLTKIDLDEVKRELADCLVAANKAYEEWSTKNEAYEACVRKHKEADCASAARQATKGCK